MSDHGSETLAGHCRAVFSSASDGRTCRFPAGEDGPAAPADGGPDPAPAGIARLAAGSADLPPARAGRPPDIRADAAALRQYTPGSTGRPKGVTVGPANHAGITTRMMRRLRIGPGSRAVDRLPYHDMSFIPGTPAPAYGHSR